MKTVFKLDNKEFTDKIIVRFLGEDKIFDDNVREISFEHNDCDMAEITLKHINDQFFDARTIKNPIGRFFASIFAAIFGFVVSAIMFFVNHDEDIHIDRWLSDVNPFVVTSLYTVKLRGDSIITVKYDSPKYDKKEKKFIYPDLTVSGCEEVDASTEIRYEYDLLKKSFLIENLPAFALIVVFLSFLIFVATAILRNVITDPFLFEGTEKVLAIIGGALCLAVIVALSVIVLCFFFKMYKLFKKVDENCKFID